MKKVFKIILIILAVIIVVIAAAFIYLTNGLDAGSKVVISGINPTSLSDGTYEGAYDAGRWSNKVSVTVKDGKITGIKLTKDVTIPMEGLSDDLFNEVISQQNTKVDIVSGATVTSKAYLMH